MGRRLSSRTWWFAGIAGLASVAAAGSHLYIKREMGDSSNYSLQATAPEGWKAVPHGPQTLFLFRHPKTGLLLRGAQNQIVADVNPTPHESNASLAQFYIDRTHDNLKDWTAKMSDSVQAKGGGFQIIDRERKDKRVLSAFGIRGNSTFIITLSGNGKEMQQIDPTVPWFKSYLANVEFRPVDYNLLVSR